MSFLDIGDASVGRLLIPAFIGVAGWFLKEFLFGLHQKRNRLERLEWEYRLKEIYCPLYFWSGLLFLHTDQRVRSRICDQLHAVMSKAAYVLPRVHYYTLIRLLEVAHRQDTSGVSDAERDKVRAHLYDQIEVLNFILYRSQDIGRVGDTNALLNPYKRLLRLLLIGLGHLLVWLLVAAIIWASLWLYQQRHVFALGVGVVALLLIVWVDLRKRAEIQRGIAARIKGKA